MATRRHSVAVRTDANHHSVPSSADAGFASRTWNQIAVDAVRRESRTTSPWRAGEVARLARSTSAQKTSGCRGVGAPRRKSSRAAPLPSGAAGRIDVRPSDRGRGSHCGVRTIVPAVEGVERRGTSAGGGGSRRPGGARRASRRASPRRTTVDRVRDHPRHVPARRRGPRRDRRRARRLRWSTASRPSGDRLAVAQERSTRAPAGMRPARAQPQARSRGATVSPIVQRCPPRLGDERESVGGRQRVEPDVAAPARQRLARSRRASTSLAGERHGRAARDCAPGRRATRRTGNGSAILA